MKWQDKYSVGIREIDDQHKHLLKLFSKIEQAIQLQSGWRAIVYDIVDLKVFARRHFELEESLMRMYGYNESEMHERMHQHFFTSLTEIESKSIADLAHNELVTFLCDWLKTHIQGADRGYAAYILSGASILKPNAPSLSIVKAAG